MARSKKRKKKKARVGLARECWERGGVWRERRVGPRGNAPWCLERQARALWVGSRTDAPPGSLERRASGGSVIQGHSKVHWRCAEASRGVLIVLPFFWRAKMKRRGGRGRGELRDEAARAR